MSKPTTAELVFFFILFAIVSFFALEIMSPYITALFMAAVLTVLFMPVFEWVKKKTKHRTLSAFITVMFVLIVVLVPLTLVGVLMFDEVVNIYNSLNDKNIGLLMVNGWIGDIQGFVRHIVPTFTIKADVYTYLEGGLRWVAQNLNGFFSGLLAVLFDIILIIAAMFFLYRDGDKLRSFALRWSPLADEYDETIIARLELAVSSVVKGALATATVQGILVGVGFTIFGVPNPVLWGVVSTVTALVPLLGTMIVTIPGVLYLYAFGHVSGAVGLFAWAFFCVGLADNILHPLLVKRGIPIHPFLILLSVFGGLAYFGPIGFIAGPVVMAFFFVLLDVYQSIMRGKSIPKESQID